MTKRRFHFINPRGEVVDSDSDVVPDGYGVRVRLDLMDEEAPMITDASGAPAGRRRGYCFASPTQATAARDAAYEEYCTRLENAWNNSPAVFDAARPSVPEATTPEDAYAARDAWLRDAWRTAR